MKLEKIRKNVEFRAVYRRGKSFSNKTLVLYLCRNRRDFNRLGVSVSKKVGSSVVRSRVKRLIKESYRLNKDKIKSGYDLIFIARNAANGRSYSEIESSILYLFKKAGLINEESNS